MGDKSETACIFVRNIPSRQNFYKAMKSPTETPDHWLSRIKKLAKLCDFGNSLDSIVLDKFITGLENEVIDYLCLCAECLDIDATVKFIHTYQSSDQTQTNDLAHVSNSNDQIMDPFQETPEVFSEILVKYEIEETEVNNRDEDNAESDFSGHFNDDDSKDSDFLCNGSSSSKAKKPDETTKISKTRKSKRKDVVKKSSHETGGSKKRNQKSTKKKHKNNNEKNPEPKDSTENPQQKNNIENSEQKTTDQTEIDPNTPKKKRKYKKRAIKEKQTFKCEICHYTCLHECHLRRHKLIHQNEKSFVCHICGKAFNLYINMNAHIRRHLGIKNHVCEVCKASFMDRTRLKLHMRTHTGEKPYGCKFCEKSFADQYYLKVHTRLHTGEKPFRCDQCQKLFSQSSSLSVHKRKNCIASLTT
ncbi:zinc finger protein OZF-like isoform X2 [Contarinia nasturtii]|uniref:zinc finger protein OZF-like isoform X2 n=1 Tax=Contarinia nasturtii TaxID=265458 RepID=UPI0012D45AAC|nr:zinc finger protein OZF-like isoform X2 [Contarinia nasturtii]